MEIPQTSPTVYLRDLTNYMGCIKLNSMSQLRLLRKAMIGPAEGWLKSKRTYIRSYRDFCLLFLDEFASIKIIRNGKGN